MKRRLLNFLKALSLLMCVAVAVLWIRSYSGADQFALRLGGKVWVLRSYDGACEYVVSRFADTRGGWSRTVARRDRRLILHDEWPDSHVYLSHSAVLAACAVFPAWRFLVGSPRRAIRPKHVVICVSIQVVFLMTGIAATRDRGHFHASIFFGTVAGAVALFCLRDLVRDACADARIPPPWRLLARSRWWRQHRGLCPSCSYDLRATPGRCPECGHVVDGT